MSCIIHDPSTNRYLAYISEDNPHGKFLTNKRDAQVFLKGEYARTIKRYFHNLYYFNVSGRQWVNQLEILSLSESVEKVC